MMHPLHSLQNQALPPPFPAQQLTSPTPSVALPEVVLPAKKTHAQKGANNVMVNMIMEGNVVEGDAARVMKLKRANRKAVNCA